MKRFAQLFSALDRTTRTNEKVEALAAYFRQAPSADAAWAVFFLTGNKLSKIVPSIALRDWVREAAAIPVWLFDECYDIVGDLAETFSLVLPPSRAASEKQLSRIVEDELLPLSGLTLAERKERMLRLWAELDQTQLFVLMKLLTGSFRTGVQRTIVARALGVASGVEPARIEHRLTGGFVPTAANYSQLVDPAALFHDPGHPYPFCLAYPLDCEPESLGEPGEWTAEWKWDGIRAQAIRRSGNILLWSRGEEVVTESFPDVAAGLAALPAGTVLDGELLAWENDRPRPFSVLQKRLGRKSPGKKVLQEIPVHYCVYDILEDNGVDVREESTAKRRARLEKLFRETVLPSASLSPQLIFNTWAELKELRERSRDLRVEGCMLKAVDAPYGAGRTKGSWWKWKVEPHTCDAVLLYAQRGQGRRAGMFTDYTFGVWKSDSLVPVAKAYSGLTDREIEEVDQYIRENAIDRFGPVTSVTPQLVFELAFDDIQVSARHKAGLALRFPRIRRLRKDKIARDADTIETLLALLHSL